IGFVLHFLLFAVASGRVQGGDGLGLPLFIARRYVHHNVITIVYKLCQAQPAPIRIRKMSDTADQRSVRQSRVGSKYVKPANTSQRVEVLVNPFSNPASKTRFRRAV